jgi:hypothetical protein
MESWIQDIYDEYGEAIVNKEIGRKRLSEECDISRWKARKALKTIRNHASEDDYEQNPPSAKDYEYDEGRKVYTFYLKCKNGRPVEFTKEDIDQLVSLYSDRTGDRMTRSETAMIMEWPEAVVEEVLDALGVTHKHPAHTPEDLEQKDVDDLVAKDKARRRFEYEQRFQKQKIRSLKRDARKYRRIEDEMKVLRDQSLSALKESAPTYEVPQVAPQSTENAVQVFNLQDLHIGNRPYDDDSDTEAYIDNLRESIERNVGLGANVASMDKIFLIVGGDTLDVDNYQGTTTAGTDQETTMSPYRILLRSQEFLVEVVDILRRYADEVELVPCFGNHDRVMSLALFTYLQAWFSEMDDVLADVEIRARHYRVYENHLIVGTHADMPKKQFKRLSQIVIGEFDGMIGPDTDVTVFTGHNHFDWEKIDLAGFKITQAPYPGKPSRWADFSGYTGARRGIQSHILLPGIADELTVTTEVEG